MKHEEGALGEGADKLDLVRCRTKVHALLVRRDVDPEVKRRKRGKDQKNNMDVPAGRGLGGGLGVTVGRGMGAETTDKTDKTEKTKINGENGKKRKNGENERYGTTRKTTEKGINAHLRCAV